MLPILLIPFGLLFYGSYKLLAYIFKPTDLHGLPGPAYNPSWFFGFVKVAWTHPPAELALDFVRQHGHVLSYPGLLSRPILSTIDSRALAHILTRTDIYEKPASWIAIFTKILGSGLVVQEGHAHRKQRKAINPAFGLAQLRALTGIMLDKANELCNVLENMTPLEEKHSFESSPLDVMPLLSQCTLDIIGLAGFGYDFSSLSSTSADQSELYEAFTTSGSFAQKSPLVMAFTFLLPGVSRIPTSSNLKMKRAMRTMERIGSDLLRERQDLIAREGPAMFEKSGLQKPRDLLSLLVQANLSASTVDRLDDKEVLAQIPTFLGAGHDTTAILLAWTLLALARRPDMQDQLRNECRSSPLPTASHFNQPLLTDELNALDKLEWMDAVVRETLRLHPPGAETNRVAVKDDEIPLSQPFVDRKGITRNMVSIKKGDDITIPISVVNRIEAIWGTDAGIWRPERWVEGIPDEARKIPGVWGNVLSFISGPHGCIGYKFSLYETKIILHTLVSRFVISLGAPSEDVIPMHGIVIRPGLRGRKDPGGCLMLKISRVKA